MKKVNKITAMLKTIFGALFGVQSTKTFAADAQRNHPLALIIAGVITAIIIICLLILVVNFVI